MDVLAQLLAPQTAEARERLVFGLVTAKVKGIEDGGVYRLDYLTMGDGQPSAPARVMMPMAGGSRGAYFFPEVGDEVVVAFELGDTNLPIILGAVWNGEDAPPSQARQSPDNDVRTIVSRSGHEITFDDRPGREVVTLKSQSGHTLTLDDQPGLGKVTLETANGAALILDDTLPGSATLRTPGGSQITISDAGGQISVEAPTGISFKSTMISMEATLIRLTTTGVVTSSLVMIDNKPFGMHQHFLVPPATTGVVAP